MNAAVRGWSSTLRDACTWPWNGHRLAVRRPKWWWYTVTGSAGGSLALLGILILLVIWHWPASIGVRDLLVFGGQVSSSLAAVLAIALPLMKAGAANRVLRDALRELGAEIEPKGAIRPWREAIRYTINTLPLRGIWIVLLVWAFFDDAMPSLLVGMWALGHLVTVSACDGVLTLLDLDKHERRMALWKRAHLLLLAGLIVGALALLLGATVIGWLIWAPAIAAGAARWVATWPEAGSALPEDLVTRLGKQLPSSESSSEDAPEADQKDDAEADTDDKTNTEGKTDDS